MYNVWHNGHFWDIDSLYFLLLLHNAGIEQNGVNKLLLQSAGKSAMDTNNILYVEKM